jgi:phosphatidylglycerol lysyltransferase
LRIRSASEFEQQDVPYLMTPLVKTEVASELIPNESDDNLEALAFQFGRTYDGYMATEERLHRFWSGDHKGVLAYAKIGRYLHVQGGLLCPPEFRETLLREFHEFARRQKFVVTFYNTCDEDLPLFRKLGFQVTKWGEEPFVDLPDLTWAGRSYEWVRRQFNFCKRQGMAFSEYCREDYSESGWNDVLNEIRAVATEALQSKPQLHEIWFFNGRFDPPNWGRRRLFVARAENGTGRIDGFLVCLPFQNGASWAVESYRHRLDAPRGLVAYMIHQCAERLKSEGVLSVSLCLCPAIRCEAMPNDSRLVRRGLQFGFNYASIFFDLPGEYHFKSRFRPRFVPRYICHWPRASVSSMWSLVRLSGVLTFDFRKLAGSLWSRIRHPKSRSHLALPPSVAPSSADHDSRTETSGS